MPARRQLSSSDCRYADDADGRIAITPAPADAAIRHFAADDDDADADASLSLRYAGYALHTRAMPHYAEAILPPIITPMPAITLMITFTLP